MKETHILALCMIAAVISFLGFIVENVWLTATKGYIDNRNMCFPFLLGYGIAILLIFIILGKITSFIYSSFISVAIQLRLYFIQLTISLPLPAKGI